MWTMLRSKMPAVFAAIFAIILVGAGAINPAAAQPSGDNNWVVAGIDQSSLGTHKGTDRNGNPVDLRPFRTSLRNANGEMVTAYCVEFYVRSAVDQRGQLRDYGSYTQVVESGRGLVDDPAAYRKINWIAHNGYPKLDERALAANAGVRNLSKLGAARVTALAVWHFSDGFTPTSLPANEMAVFNYLTGPANVGLSTVDSANRTGYIFEAGSGQNQVVVDTDTPPAGPSSSEQTTTPEPTTEETTTPEPTTEETTTPEPTTEETTTPEETTSETPTESSTVPEQPEVPATPDLNPAIGTQARLDGNQIVAGATVVDTVSYEDLVPGKEYTLSARLMNKANNAVIGNGSVTFTPTSANGEQQVLITVNGNVTSPVESGVAFERLTSTEVTANGSAGNGSSNVIATHEDINDTAQTVNGEVPEETTPEETTSETPTESSTVPEQPEVPASPDLNPEIATQARLNGSQVVAGATVIDTVSFSDLVPGKKYTLTAQLINKADESVIGTGSATFTPSAANGEQNVIITVDDSVTEPVEAAVAFERLTSTEVTSNGSDGDGSENVIATHEDINDQNQTVNSTTPVVPETTEETTTSETTDETTSETTPEETTSETTPEETTSETPTESSTVPEQPEVPASPDLNPEIATQARLDGNVISAGATVVDVVSFKDLVPGASYTLTAKLINKADESVIGTGTVNFTPDSANGEQKVLITVSEGVTTPVASAVAFERLTSNEVDKQGNPITDGSTEVIATHEDINDQNQTVNSTNPVVPEPTTEPSSTEETTSETTSPEESTSETTPVNSTTETTSEETTTPGTTVPAKPEVPSSTTPGESTQQTTTPGESTQQTTPGESTEQTTTPEQPTSEPTEPVTPGQGGVPTIKTTASIDGNGLLVKGAQVNDKVTMTGLTPGKKYILEGTLMCKDTGLATGPAVSFNFIAKAANTVVEVKIPVTDDSCAEQVVFETLKTEDGTVVATHHDINDKAQTVTGTPNETPEGGQTTEPTQPTPSQTPEPGQPTESTPTTQPTQPSKPGEPAKPTTPEQPAKEQVPAISTTAGIAGGARVEKGATVIDTVHFTGLKAGHKYTLKGELFCKDTGKSTGAVGTMEFVPQATSGKVDVPIVITDASCASQVAFETLIDADGNVVATHHDINDEKQTVVDGKAPETPQTPEGEQPSKGDSSNQVGGTNINQQVGQNNVNVTVIGGSGQPTVKDHGKPLAPNTERRVITNIPSGPTGMATHALPTVATR